MKLLLAVVATAMFGTLACGGGAPPHGSDGSPTTRAHSQSLFIPTATPTIELHPVPHDRLGDALIEAADLPDGARLWTQQNAPEPNEWESGLCGTNVGPTPLSTFTRRFVGSPGGSQPGWIVESIMLFAPGDAATLMTASDTSAQACDTELRASGHALFRPQFPRIRNESLVFTVESFSCCVTPRPDEPQLPHDIVYIRDGDAVLHVYASIDVVEPAARATEDRLDGVHIAGN